MLTDLQKDVVKRLAQGEATLRAEAEVIHYANIKAHVDCSRKSCHLNFLSEVFNVCPDYTLKALYRKQVLAEN